MDTAYRITWPLTMAARSLDFVSGHARWKYQVCKKPKKYSQLVLKIVWPTPNGRTTQEALLYKDPV